MLIDSKEKLRTNNCSNWCDGKLILAAQTRICPNPLLLRKSTRKLILQSQFNQKQKKRMRHLNLFRIGRMPFKKILFKKTQNKVLNTIIRSNQQPQILLLRGCSKTFHPLLIEHKQVILIILPMQKRSVLKLS